MKKETSVKRLKTFVYSRAMIFKQLCVMAQFIYNIQKVILFDEVEILACKKNRLLLYHFCSIVHKLSLVFMHRFILKVIARHELCTVGGGLPPRRCRNVKDKLFHNNVSIFLLDQVKLLLIML